MKAGAIIVAAGKGRRMGAETNKVFLPLSGRPLLLWSIEAFLATPPIEPVILVAAPSETEQVREMMLAAFPGATGRLKVVSGGRERQDSVYNGLQVLPPVDVVCIHDGARPLLTGGIIRQGIETALNLGAAVPAIPVTDTIKIVNGKNIVETPPRDNLRAIQTPQCFRRQLLLQAYQKARTDGYLGSDDASLLERVGTPVAVFPGDRDNLKVTTPGDLVLAQYLLERRGENCSQSE